MTVHLLKQKFLCVAIGSLHGQERPWVRYEGFVFFFLRPRELWHAMVQRPDFNKDNYS